MPRPKKYHTEETRKAAIKFQKKQSAKKSAKRISGRYWRLVIPNLKNYSTDWNYKSSDIIILKQNIVDLLTLKQKSRGLDGYTVAVERHSGSSLPHLDILLKYSKNIRNTLTRYDYLIKHGNLSKYKTLNKAILEYGLKEDPHPLSNINIKYILLSEKASDRKGLYNLLQQAMIKDPFKFNCDKYLHYNDLDRHAVMTSWETVIRKLQRKQSTVCNQILKNKPGIIEITPQIITERLSKEELKVFKSWNGYQVIVDHINQISKYGCCRPHKSQSINPLDYKNLYICGLPGTGKTALGLQIEKHCSVYPLGTPGGWFPEYENGVYRLLMWDEFDLKTYKYTSLLKLLEGRPMKLPQKGGHVPRADNQLILMTSNLTLKQHIYSKFKSAVNRAHSMRNLRERITEVKIPKGLNLFILNKLLVSNVTYI